MLLVEAFITFSLGSLQLIIVGLSSVKSRVKSKYFFISIGEFHIRRRLNVRMASVIPKLT